MNKHPMKDDEIPFHTLPKDEFFLLEKIEESDESNYTGYHRHHFYEILWFTDISLEEKHSIDFDDYTISPNQVYITVKQLILNRSFTEAKRYIVFDSMSLKEIAYQLGFSDPAYFSRIFKQKYERFLPILNF